MGLAELANDLQRPDSGGAAFESTVANMVEKISTRLIKRAREFTEHKQRQKRLKNVLKIGAKLAGGSMFEAQKQPAVLSDIDPIERPSTEIESKLVLSASRRIAAWAKRSDLRVEEFFRKIDTDASGSVDFVEFRTGLGDAGLAFDNRTMKALLRYMDDSGDEALDIDEFCYKMDQILQKHATSPAVVLAGFCRHLRASSKAPATFFQELDDDNSGCLDAAEFQLAMEKVGILVSEQEAVAAMAELDMDGDSTLQISELVDNIEEFSRRRRVFAATVLGKICDYVHMTNTSVVRVFARVDSDGSGSLDVLEMQEAMRRMGQDLSELEVEEVMDELSTGGAAAAMTAPQFLDRLKQFERERIVDTAKCETLFSQFDADGSGALDRNEVRQLAGAMGLEEQLTNENCSLTLDRLIADIEAQRANDDDEEDDGLISFDELLPWFLNVGRSYLPAPVYHAVEELGEPSEQELLAMFAGMDEDGSGEVNEQEVKTGTLSRWPYLETKLIETAFEAADMDRSGSIVFDEFDELVRCLQFLNMKRHVFAELLQQFQTGVGDDEFYVGLTSLDISTTDTESRLNFEMECTRLNKERLTAHELVLWACRHECINNSTSVTAEEMAIAAATADLQSRMTEYGDIFFDDLAATVFTNFTSRRPNGHGPKTKSPAKDILVKGRSAAKETAERFQTLKAGISAAIKKHESFPAIPDHIIRKFVLSCKSDLLFSGQNIITQGHLESSFFVIRRGKAEVVVDGVVVGTVQAGDPLGELALMYGSRRSATIRCMGPCEVFYLERAAYDTAMATLPIEERQGPLVKVMERYWELVSGPGGSNRPEVDYAVYLKYHMRITKTLTRHCDMDDYDEDEQRQIAQDDWMEDVKRFGVKPSGSLTVPMFFDSVYQMVDLWAGDLDISFTEFLEVLFVNIAEWIEEDKCWKFKPMAKVLAQGEKLDLVHERAKEKMIEEARLKKEAEEAAEKFRLQQEQAARERRQRMRERHERDKFLSDIKNQIAALDDEEAAILRRLTAENLTPEEEEALRRRLAEIAQERIDLKLKLNHFEQAQLLRRLETGELSPEEEENLRRQLAALKQAELQLEIDKLDAEEAEIVRRLATGLLTPHEEEELRRRLAELQQDRIALELSKLDIEQSELQRRLATGLLTPEEEEDARRRIAAIALDRIGLSLKGLELEEVEIRRLLTNGLLTPSEEAALRKRLGMLQKDRIRLQLQALDIEADELRRRLTTSLLTLEEQEAARQRLQEIEEERKRLQGLYNDLCNPDPRGEDYLNYAARTAALQVRDVTTSQVRFSRAERMKRLQTRQQRHAEIVAKKRSGDTHQKNQSVLSPARQRQAERRAQAAAQRAIKARPDEDRAIDKIVSSPSSWESDSVSHMPSSIRHGNDDMQGTWPSTAARDRSVSNWRRRTLSGKPNAIGGRSPPQLWPAVEPPLTTEAYQKLLRPGRTKRVDRQIGFGRSVELIEPLAKETPSQRRNAIAQSGSTKCEKRRSRKKQRRRRLQRRQHHTVGSASSMPVLPPASHNTLGLARDDAWRTSTYCTGARLLVRERSPPQVWYAQDESRRFIKGNYVKGALPQVGRPGPGSSTVA